MSKKIEAWRTLEGGLNCTSKNYRKLDIGLALAATIMDLYGRDILNTDRLVFDRAQVKSIIFKMVERLDKPLGEEFSLLQVMCKADSMKQLSYILNWFQRSDEAELIFQTREYKAA